MFREAALIAVLVSIVPSALGCMGVARPGVAVRFAGQENIVVWDGAHGIEHFVRDAKFQAKGSDLGFIAPTPSRPTVEGVDGSAFGQLAALNPKRFSEPSGKFGGRGGGPGSGGGGGVSVVEVKIVSGYEATVLKASDPSALTDWLSSHGYATPKYAAQWAAPYVSRGWYFTAFKVSNADTGGSTGPVRMTFSTTQAFNPYSVPAENGGSSGLSLYFVSAGGETPLVGGVKPWESPKWIVPLKDEAAAQLAKNLKLAEGAVPAKSYVRFYRDGSFGKPGTDDLYFMPAAGSGQGGEGHAGAGGGGLLASLFVGCLAFVRVGRQRG